MMPYPFHMVGANLPGYKKPAVIVPANYYGCDPYNTVDAAEVRRRVIWHQVPARAWTPLSSMIPASSLRTWRSVE